MPTHIDVLLGDYERVIADNEAAIAADDRSVALAGQLNFYSLYRAHDHHFRIYGAMFAGRQATALAAADALEVYAADLGLDQTLPRACQHPGNVWSLRGYHECLTRLGRAGEAATVRPLLEHALAAADIAISSSCSCRLQPVVLAD
jgi:hypothetical protein